MSSPDRDNYDPSRYDYDAESDTLTDRCSGKEYDGDGNDAGHRYDD